MSSGLHNNDFLFDLLHLPGVVTLTLFEDMTQYFWDTEKPLTDERYIDYLIAAQRSGIYPDLDRRQVTFEPELLIKTFPAMRRWRVELENLRPLTFNGKLPARPRTLLRVIEGGLSHAVPTQEAV
jgi:hypothetical protein